MPGLLGKRFNAPVAKPLWPFGVAALVILYGVNAAQNGMSNTDEFATDPRNPMAAANAKKAAH